MTETESLKLAVVAWKDERDPAVKARYAERVKVIASTNEVAKQEVLAANPKLVETFNAIYFNESEEL